MNVISVPPCSSIPLARNMELPQSRRFKKLILVDRQMPSSGNLDESGFFYRETAIKCMAFPDYPSGGVDSTVSWPLSPRPHKYDARQKLCFEPGALASAVATCIRGLRQTDGQFVLADPPETVFRG